MPQQPFKFYLSDMEILSSGSDVFENFENLEL